MWAKYGRGMGNMRAMVYVLLGTDGREKSWKRRLRCRLLAGRTSLACRNIPVILASLVRPAAVADVVMVAIGGVVEHVAQCIRLLLVCCIAVLNATSVALTDWHF